MYCSHFKWPDSCFIWLQCAVATSNGLTASVHQMKWLQLTSVSSTAEPNYFTFNRYICTPDLRKFQRDRRNHICLSFYLPVIYGAITSIFLKSKRISKKLKLRLKNTIIDKTLTCASETWTLTKRDRKQLNVF